MSLLLTFVCCLVCYLAGQYRGFIQGRAAAFAEVQRWHLEDEEALKRASEQGLEARQAQA